MSTKNKKIIEDYILNKLNNFGYYIYLNYHSDVYKLYMKLINLMCNMLKKLDIINKL